MKGNDIMIMPKETRKAVKKLINYLLKQEASFDVGYHDLINVLEITVVNRHLNVSRIDEIIGTVNCATAKAERTNDITYIFDWSELEDV